MKATITPVSKYNTENEYFDVTINGTTHERLERSEIRHLIQILDNGIE